MARFAYEIAAHDLNGLPEVLLAALECAGLGSTFHWSGRLEIVERRPRIAMIGSRRPGSESAAAMEALAVQLATAGATIVSGAAHGTDMASHRGALHCGVPTIACVPQGIATLDRDNWRRDFRGMPETDLLLLLSPFSPRQPVSRQTPIVRNRLIAALAEVVVAGEAGVDSGTQWCLANAFEFGVPVFLMEPADEGDARLAARQRGMENRGAEIFRAPEAFGPGLAQAILRRAGEHHAAVCRARDSQLRLFD